MGALRHPTEIEELERRAAPVLAEAGASFALLFGSHAKKRAHPDSDVDIAVAGPVDLLALRRDLCLALAREVDLMHVKDATLPLLYAWVHDGIVLFRKDTGALARWWSEALLELELDYPNYLRMTKGFLRHLAARSARG